MKIVFFHLNQIGDLVFSLPALKCVRESFPDAHITSIIRPSSMEVLESTGLVDEVFAKPSGLLWNKMALARRLRAQGFDLAVALSQSATSAILGYLSGAPKRIGFINTSYGKLLTHCVAFNHPPSTENNLRLIEAVGARITTTSYSGLLKPASAQEERADRLLTQCGIAPDEPVAALSPGTSGRRSIKEWTDEGFAEVGEHLIEQGLKVVILGTVPVDGITARCRQICDLSGKTDLGTLVAVLHRCRLLVSVDSGVLHLGAAAGTRVVGLYGPSDPRITGPQGDGHVVITSGAPCSPCIQVKCKYNRECMTNLSAGEVVGAVDTILAEGPGGN